MPQLARFNVADVNTASSGDNTIIAASTLQPIVVWKIWLIASGGANNLIFKHGSTAFNAGIATLTANGSMTFLYDGSPWFTTLLNEAFKINLSAATQLTGQVYYSLG